MAKERQCICCQNSYQYCPHCGEYAKYPAWMTEFDTEECKELFNAISGFNMGIKKADDVKKVINKYGITDFNKFKPSIASKLNELFGNKYTFVDTPVVEEISEPVVEETEVSEPTVEETIRESENEAVFKEQPRRRRRINRIDED